jgi:hypothetical protein
LFLLERFSFHICIYTCLKYYNTEKWGRIQDERKGAVLLIFSSKARFKAVRIMKEAQPVFVPNCAGTGYAGSFKALPSE